MLNLKQPLPNWSANYSGVDVNSGIGDAVPDSVGDTDCVGDCIGAAVMDAIGDDFGSSSNDLEGRSMEGNISTIRATSIGTTTPTATAHFVQYKIVEP